MMTQVLAAASAVAAKGTFNPFDGISPDFGPFAPLLESRTDKIIAAVWAGAFVYLAYRLITNTAAFSKAKKGRYGKDLDEAKEEMVWSAGALVAVAAVGSIYGVLVAF